MAEIDELRRQLAETSVELEEIRENNKRKLAMQEKDIEEHYMELSNYGHDEKGLRVKVKQLENDLDLQIKRLDIICKTKGLPRPQRKRFEGEGVKGRSPGSYVSPYRQNGSTSKDKQSNGSNSRKFSPFRNNYTPPNKRVGYSPSNLSNGSKGSKGA